MGGEAALEAAGDEDEGVGDREVDQAGRDVELVGLEAAGDEDAGDAGQVEQRDDRDQRRRLEQEHHLVGVGRQRQAERLGQDDAPVEQDPGHAEGARRLDLAARHRLDRAAQDLRGVGGGVQGEGQDGAEIRLAEQHPQPDAVEERLELPGAVIDEEELHQERGPAEIEDVAVDRHPQKRAARKPQHRERDRQAQADGDAHQRDLQGQRGAAQQAGQALPDDGEVHRRPQARRVPRLAQASARRWTAIETTVMPR